MEQEKMDYIVKVQEEILEVLSRNNCMHGDAVFALSRMVKLLIDMQTEPRRSEIKNKVIEFLNE